MTVSSTFHQMLNAIHCPNLILSISARIKLFPRFGNSLGGTPILIDIGIEISESDEIYCTFEDKRVIGQSLNRSIVICVSPFLQSTSAFIPFKLRIGDRSPYEENFLTSKYL